MSQGSIKFSNYAAKVIFISTLIFSVIGSMLVFALVPKFLWQVSREITVSTANSLKATVLPYLNAGDWNGINQIISSQNAASQNQSIFYLYDPQENYWLSGDDSKSSLRDEVSLRVKDCSSKAADCSDLGTVFFEEVDWHILMSDPIPSYSSKKLSIVTAVNTEGIDRAASKVMYMILSILLSMAVMSFFVTRYLFNLTVGKPLESLTLILSDENTDLQRLRDFLSQSFFYEVSRIGESVNSLWIRLIQSEKEREKHARYAAIARAVQMLAHDIRKPFSMIKITLMILKKARTIDEMTSALSRSEKNILRMISQVDGLLEDVIEIDRKAESSLSALPLEASILAVVQDLSSTDPAPGVNLSAAFSHRGLVLLDPPRFSRVLGNILTNAIEALKGSGKISIATENLDQGGLSFVKLEIANDGPPIPDANLGSLFDPFFTRGKPEGTGLGLAIAKKIVESHGGSISCRSNPKEGVVFSLTLRIASLEFPPTNHQEIEAGFTGASRNTLPGEELTFPKHF